MLLLVALGCLAAASTSGAGPASEHPRDRVARAEIEADRESPPERLSREELEERAAGRIDPVPVGATFHNLRTQSHSPSGLDWTFLGPRPITGGYWTNDRNA